MNPVATTDQRRATLRAIDRAEARMLPPGWDAGLEHQFGATLTDTRATAPLLIDAAEPDSNDDAEQLAAIAEWNRQKPAREAAAKRRREQLNSLTKWLLTAGICAGLALIWATSH